MRRVVAGGFGVLVMAAGLSVAAPALADPPIPCGVSSYPVGDQYINVRFKNCTQKGMVVRPWDENVGAQGDCRPVAANGDWATWTNLPIEAANRDYGIVNCRD